MAGLRRDIDSVAGDLPAALAGDSDTAASNANASTALIVLVYLFIFISADCYQTSLLVKFFILFTSSVGNGI